MMDWKRCMLLFLMCLTAVCREHQKVVVKIFVEEEQWLQCNKWKGENFPDNFTSAEYLCTTSRHSTSLQINCSSQSMATQGPLTGPYTAATRGGKGDLISNTHKITSAVTSTASMTTAQGHDQLTQKSIECTNCSGEECKKSWAGSIAAAVIVSFLFGTITGVSVLFLVYIHRTKQFSFQRNDQSESVVSEKTKVDIKCIVQKAPSMRCTKSKKGAGSGPVTGEISTELCQYEDVSSDVKQARTYGVLKHEAVAAGCHGVPGDTTTDSKHLNVNVYDQIQDCNISDAYFVLEDENLGNSHSITNTGKPKPYETVEIGNLTSGCPIFTKEFKPRNSSTEEMSISGDMCADESKSHEYFILEATPDAKCTENNMDLCSRRETGNQSRPASYPLNSQNEAENLLSERKVPESHGPQCHVYHILEVQKNQRNEAVS